MVISAENHQRGFKGKWGGEEIQSKHQGWDEKQKVSRARSVKNSLQRTIVVRKKQNSGTDQNRKAAAAEKRGLTKAGIMGIL